MSARADVDNINSIDIIKPDILITLIILPIGNLSITNNSTESMTYFTIKTQRINIDMNNVYCSTKFNEMLIHVQSRLLYNCCKAWPERIDIDWLEKNPGSLFLTETMKQDRELMLSGKRSKSCEHGCYQYEDQGLVSKRSKKEGNQNIITDPLHNITSIDIALSTDCNLTCAYCSSEWSTSWTRDLKNNGKYKIEGYNNRLDNWSKIWQKTKIKDRSWNLRFYKLLSQELKQNKSIKNINLLGGEPLLNDYIFEIINSNPEKTFNITTGLGVGRLRFLNVVERIKDKKNVHLSISAEATGKIFEFIRFGVKWKDYLEMIEILEKNCINIRFSSCITNLSIFNICNFYDLFSSKYHIRYGNVTDRTFLQPNILDEKSKAICLDQIKDRKEEFFNFLKKEISQPCNDKEKNNLSIFLKEFSTRRNLKLDIFPEHFLKWLDIV
jgi:organic radical activating enzyme